MILFEWIGRMRKQREKNRAILKELSEQQRVFACGLCLARRASAAAPGEQQQQQAQALKSVGREGLSSP
jgi:hypothetical protein